MRTYNITVNDSLIERVQPALGSNADISQWLQLQVEALLLRLAARQKNESPSYTPDMTAILSIPLLDNIEVGTNGEHARMDYYEEKYAL